MLLLYASPLALRRVLPGFAVHSPRVSPLLPRQVTFLLLALHLHNICRLSSLVGFVVILLLFAQHDPLFSNLYILPAETRELTRQQKIQMLTKPDFIANL